MTELEPLAREVAAGAMREYPWEAFRIAHFPGSEHEEAARELGAWAIEHDVEVDFSARVVEIAGRKYDVIYVLFTAKPAGNF